jgi:predicted secreted protein|tara:strand:- start:395 stop:640 length:246 start_codon:yes stop_codon:yes gene_type:complete
LSLTGSLIIYVLIWWIVFFALLPIDVNREKKQNIIGIDAGAPENPKIIKKFVYSTLITSIIFIIIFLLVKYEYLNIRNLIS